MYLPSPTKTTLVGILNVTPDSFSDGGLYFSSATPVASAQLALERAQQMLSEGADIIDIGGESTRPGAAAISVQEELDRVLPVITAIQKKLGSMVPISIDTYKSAVADAALKAGATLINSLGGSRFDPQIYEVAKNYNCPIIIYHIKGEPRTMQQGEIIYDDVVNEISEFFAHEIKLAAQSGLSKEHVWLDPGIGFGKTLEQNLEIIRRLHEFKKFNLPIAIGVSRKSHLGTLLKDKLSLPEVPPPDERLEAALAETVVAVLNGAGIVRTHDVFATRKCLAVVDELRKHELSK